MSGRPSAPRLWTVPPSAPFLDCLAQALRAGTLVPPRADGRAHDLADYTVLLPTRRACRALTDLLADGAADGAILLPRIRPIGEVDEVELALDVESLSVSAAALSFPPAIDPLARHVLLSEMVLTWGRTIARSLIVPGRDEPVAIPVQPADAAMLARELARLIDDFETGSRSFDGLGDLVPTDHADYWRITIEFLRIVTGEWPGVLAERGVVDPATRRDALVRAEAARLAASPPATPLIVAGSTGSIPASAELMAAIARLPAGAVLLPGLDTCLDEDAWRAIDDPLEPHPGHPQFTMKRLLHHVGARRGDVATLYRPSNEARERLLSETFRPAATTERWAGLARPTGEDGALDGLGVVEAANEQEEALAIALILREAIEDDGATASLVTPDRTLARRVAAELLRWNVRVDDSAGVPLAETPAGSLFRLVAETAAARLAPVTLVSLLQHPLAAFGAPPATTRRAGRALELLALRGPRPAPGSAALLRVLEREKPRESGRRRHAALRRLDETDREAALDLAHRLAEAFAPLERIGAAGAAAPLRDLVAAHIAAYRLVSAHDDGVVDEPLEDFMEALVDAADARLEVTLDEYPALLGALMAGRTVRPRTPGHPRVAILGPLEARLLRADVTVLGGLNEGTWPAETRTDPFLNRAMRRDVGLESPERFIGLAAHDVATLLAQPRVVATRALKQGGEPTVASRWLQRLAAVAGGDRYRGLVAQGARYVAWARALDESRTRQLPVEPRPRPAPALRPDQLRVSEVETLIRDPYAIYARRILRLEPLDPLDQPPDAATRGTLIHAALNAWLAKDAPGDPLVALIAEGERVFAEIDDFPEVRAIWWPRFLRIARWFVAEDAGRAGDFPRRLGEIAGALARPAGAGAVTLVGRADRIDVAPDGGVRILDYKTGAPPSAKQVVSGLAPQLPLEALIAREGGFGGIAAGSPVRELVYVHLTGRQTPGAWCAIDPKPRSLDELIEETGTGLARLLAGFARPETPYRAKTRVEQRATRTDYDHLSRFVEWNVTGGDGGE